MVDHDCGHNSLECLYTSHALEPCADKSSSGKASNTEGDCPVDFLALPVYNRCPSQLGLLGHEVWMDNTDEKLNPPTGLELITFVLQSCSVSHTATVVTHMH